MKKKKLRKIIDSQAIEICRLKHNIAELQAKKEAWSDAEVIKVNRKKLFDAMSKPALKMGTNQTDVDLFEKIKRAIQKSGNNNKHLVIKVPDNHYPKFGYKRKLPKAPLRSIVETPEDES